MRKTKSWVQRRLLAKDSLPGTRFDGLMEFLIQALAYAKEESKDYFTAGQIDIHAMAKDTIYGFGLSLVKAMKERNSQLFYDWGNAVENLRLHRPCPDKLRQAIIEFCIPPTKPVSVRSVLAHLKTMGYEVQKPGSSEHGGKAESTKNLFVDARTVRRICAEFSIPTDHKAGAPRKADRTA
jgi:hypothetical protein